MAIYIGIDPGAHTGLAVWDSTSRAFLEVATLPIWRAMKSVLGWRDTCAEQSVPLVVIFEDARQRKWFKEDRNSSEYRGHLMGAGAAKRDAAIWEEFLNDHAIVFQATPPRPRLTKWKADYWAHVTGWKGRTSEHSRDAALLVFGKC